MKKYFLTGLVTLLPLAVTIWVAHFVIDFLTKPFIGLISVVSDRYPEHHYPGLVQIPILFILFLLILFLGFVARRFFFSQILRFGDRLLIKIPIVNKVYKTSKEIVKSLFGSKTSIFKQVVMMPFPYQGCYCIGLVAREAPDTCSRAEHDELVSVFIPTTPNPTTGFLVMSHKSELIYLDMKNEEALKYIVSVGMIQPKWKKE